MPVITFGTLADDPLGIASTIAEGINGLGQIVGIYITPNPGIHGFLYTSGDYTTIDDPLGTQGDFANGINGVGQIVGSYQITINGVSHGFLYNPYSGTPYTTLDAPGSAQGTFANGINGAGQIVGSYNDASGLGQIVGNYEITINGASHGLMIRPPSPGRHGHSTSTTWARSSDNSTLTPTTASS